MEAYHSCGEAMGKEAWVVKMGFVLLGRLDRLGVLDIRCGVIDILEG